jgi:hypothetical protein
MLHHHHTSQEDTMASCPTTPGHRCWDCAPTRRGRPFSADGLSTGSPFTTLPRDTPADPADRKREFERMFARETVTVTSKTFGGRDDPIHNGDPIAAPNHNGVIVTVNPYSTPKPAKTSTRKAPSAAAARKALVARIPVTITTNRI